MSLKLSDFDNEITYEYYKMALLDIAEGVSIEEIEEHLAFYEEHEMYEECAGILKAINESKYYTLNNLKNDQTIKGD